MTDHVPDHSDLSLLNGPLYKDTSIPKDIVIKISSNNKDTCTPGYRDARTPGDEGTSKDTSATLPRYDYLSLRNILGEEMDKPITVEQAELIGRSLVDLYSALYFDES